MIQENRNRRVSVSPNQKGLTMKRTAILLYGILSYCAFFFTICYAIGFVGDFLVPKSVNTVTEATAARPFGLALAINVGILGLFAIQHTIMARPAFKRWWTTIIPKSAERSTFVIIASGILLLLFWQWTAFPGIVWEVTNPVVAGVLWTGFGVGWALVFLATFLINHFDLFGLRQVWLQFRGIEYAPVGFRQPFAYRIVRHPLMLGFLIAFWCTPVMTWGHLLFSGVVTGYILFGTWIEERDLISEHGDSYRTYRKRVPGLLPIPRSGGQRLTAEPERANATLSRPYR